MRRSRRRRKACGLVCHAMRSIFEEPGVEQWIRNLPMEDILTFLQDCAVASPSLVSLKLAPERR